MEKDAGAGAELVSLNRGAGERLASARRSGPGRPARHRETAAGAFPEPGRTGEKNRRQAVPFGGKLWYNHPDSIYPTH